VALHLAVQFQVRPYPKWNDALLVMDFARRFPHLPHHWRFEPVPVAQHALRIGMILPARAFQEVFGYGQVAFYAWPMLAGIVLVLATYWLGALLFSRPAAVLAALIVILHPLLVRDTVNNTSWQLLPDIPAAALFALGMALLIAGARRSRWWLVGAGVCFGWAYLAREFAVLTFPAIVVALVAWRLPWRRWPVVAAPMVALLALEMVLAWRMHGDALARWRVGAAHTDPPLPHYSRADALQGFWHMLATNPGAELMLTMMALTVLLAVVVRRRAFVLCAVWCGSLWLGLLLGGGLLDPHHVWARDTSARYWVGLLVPVALAGAGVLDLVRTRVPAFAVVAAAALLAFYGAHDLRYIERFHLGSDESGLTPARWSALRAFLHAHDAQFPRIASDGHTLSGLDLMYRYAPIGGAVEWHGAAIVVNHPHWYRPRPSEVGGAALLWSRHTSHKPRLSDGWRVAWSSDNGRFVLYEPLPSGR
jgi:hypothetical protein